MTTVLALAFLFLGLLFLGISIPLWLKKVPRNRWYGVRTKRTMSDDVIWYKSNETFGGIGIFVSIFFLMWSAILYYISGSQILSGNVGLIVGLMPVILLPAAGVVSIVKN